MPRAGLTPERVEELGCAVADDVGWELLTLAAVAQRAGVRLPSLYKHVASVEDLRERIAARTVTELRAAVAEAVAGASGRAALRAVAQAYRAFALAHPGRYPAVVRAPGPDDVVAGTAAGELLGTIDDALAAYGLEGDDRVDGVRIVRSALHGFVSLETRGGFRMPRDVERTFARMVDALDAALRAVGGVGGDPGRAARVGSHP
ncbi:TetR/AcrR family transcriptional regulator [Georgenia sp. AZ-5]|uniref:TetR/AcrR family transcriptional regulator n=1 Tax=Georgenia sp. AZ-5 TaxID=3367526 RepID=UPI003754AC5C